MLVSKYTEAPFGRVWATSVPFPLLSEDIQARNKGCITFDFLEIFWHLGQNIVV
jgi:hypothetical protein